MHTDDLPAWTNLITDLNNTTYPGGVIQIRAPWTATGFTGRSGISSILPTINKQIHISGYGSLFNSNTGNYQLQGGACIAYVGTSNDGGTSFSAVMTFAPTAEATSPNLKNVVLEHFWIDCSNGGQNEALKGISMQSCFAWQINDVFIQDPCAVGVEWLVIEPGTAGALGEAKDCSRGSARQLAIRCIDAPVATPAAATTTTTVVAFASLTTLALAAALTNQPAAGYVWVQSNLGYPVLVRYTSGGGTTTLSGCSCSTQDTINAPSTVSGSNVVQAYPGNACAFLLDGDLTANANLNHFDTCQAVYTTTPTWGPAGVELRNSDSNEFSNCVINGGNPASLAQPNRVTKPGVRDNGSNSNQTLASRNNVFKSGSAGAGGYYQVGLLNTGALLLAQAGPTYWAEYQLGNGEAIPVSEGNSYIQWSPNGALGDGTSPAPVAVATGAGQTLTAATSTLITGSVVAVPPQGFQIGTTLRWTFTATKTAAGTAARTIFVRVGTTATTSDAALATITSGVGTAAIDVGWFTVQLTIIGPLGSACAAQCQFHLAHNLTATGWSTIANQVAASNATGATVTTIAMATFNSTTAQQFLSLSITTGAAEAGTI